MTKETVLADFHKKHKGRMVEFAGWSLPVMYTSIIEEHMAVRESAGLFDVSHMGQCEVEGPDALAFLNLALTNDFSDLSQNKARYSLLCNEKGECIDDLIVYKLSDRRFLVVLNASNTCADMVQLHDVANKSGLNVEVSDVSHLYSMLAVQGPKSPQVLKETLWIDLANLEKFAFANLDDMLISRTGYTGSDGFEIICKNDDAEKLADHFVEAGAKPCGLGARDSLRLEARYPLYGHEISKEISPFEANLGWAVKLGKNFVGRDALAKIKESGLKRKVAYFKANDRRIVRDGENIFNDGKEAGHVLSGVWSPIQNAPIMSAIIDTQRLESPLYAEIRGTKITLEPISKFI